MGMMKRHAEEVSDEMGFEGELTDEVLEEAQFRLDALPCICIIKHAISTEDRLEARHRLTNARVMGDSVGLMVALAQLSRCPQRGKDDR